MELGSSHYGSKTEVLDLLFWDFKIDLSVGSVDCEYIILIKA